MEAQHNPKGNQNESDADFFGDPLLTQTAREDPLFVFLKKHWRQIAVVVAAVLVGYLAQSTFRKNYEESLGRAGEIYANLHREWQSVEALERELQAARKEKEGIDQSAAATQAQKDAAAKKLEEVTQKLEKSGNYIKELLLALSDTGEPYSGLAATYQALHTARGGDIAAVRAALSAQQWLKLEAESPQRYFAELAVFGFAGRLLDIPDAAVQLEAVTAFKSLADKGTYLNTVSALRLARLARTPEEIADALARLQAVAAARPEDSTLLSQEIKRLGGK